MFGGGGGKLLTATFIISDVTYNSPYLISPMKYYVYNLCDIQQYNL